MKVMISQPMNGKTTEQIMNERKDVVIKLENQGHTVMDTVFAEESPADTDAALFYLAKSIDAMSKVDAVLFMKGWNEARGCAIEHLIADAYGKRRLYEADEAEL